MNDFDIKIIKKHLHYNSFNEDVYILQYKHSIFNIEYWKEFPVYFIDETILKDFIENAFIFNFKFNKFKNNDSLFYNRYKYSGKKYDILISTLNKISKYHIFCKQSEFKIVEDSNKIWSDNNVNGKGKLLSYAYENFISQHPTGLSDIIEEKTYKLVQE